MKKEHHHFFQDVFEVVKLIPKGRVTTYGAIGEYLVEPQKVLDCLSRKEFL